jgi:3-dehydroquinate synthase
LVLALGGGVLGDLGGFAAATYKRGIPFVQMPSTLLSMVDSSVGGKLGVDFSTPDGLIKNLVGAFYQPSLVLVDPKLLKTLPLRELKAGLAEVVKTAVLFDPVLFRQLEKNAARLLKAEPALLAAVIAACVAHKARVVSRDEFDVKGERALLNLGHTFGHAVEAASGFKLLHGEGVAFGLACAVDLSQSIGLVPPMAHAELARIPALLVQLGLPIRLKRLPLSKVMSAMGQDKKFEAGARFILPIRLGKSRVVPLPSLDPAAFVLESRFD